MIELEPRIIMLSTYQTPIVVHQRPLVIKRKSTPFHITADYLVYSVTQSYVLVLVHQQHLLVKVLSILQFSNTLQQSSQIKLSLSTYFLKLTMFVRALVKHLTPIEVSLSQLSEGFSNTLQPDHKNIQNKKFVLNQPVSIYVNHQPRPTPASISIPKT